MLEPLTTDDKLGQRLMLAFAVKDHLRPDVLEGLRAYRPAGVTLFRHLNVDHPAQVRQLTATLQAAARQAGLPRLLIAADQEGGQLMAIGEGATSLPGNMALGAAGSPQLAQRAGEVLGRELAAMGVNVDYAPCADVNVNPQNPVVGVRSFGGDPRRVAELTAAMVSGIQSTGVAATAKHFPGHGDTSSDSHRALPVLTHNAERLRSVELPPFRAAIGAGVRLVMTAHLALPALTARDDLPATLSPVILKGLLRAELGFDGVIVTDAMDMQAIRQGTALGEQAVAAACAGADLLLLGGDADDHRRVHTSLARALREGAIDRNELDASVERVLALKDWLSAAPVQPDLDVIGCAAHRQVATDIAGQAITLVRDHAHRLPITLRSDQRAAVVLPQSIDLTPADTSSTVQIGLSSALRAYLPHVEEFVLPANPTEGDIAAILPRLSGFDCVIVGTLAACQLDGQAALVRAVLRAGLPTVVIGLRLPYDLAAFPDAPTYVCTYGILPPSMDALARSLTGQAGFPGRLPVSIPGLYPVGHRDPAA
jgi:beta-N-acetylhexosaminidase